MVKKKTVKKSATQINKKVKKTKSPNKSTNSKKDNLEKKESNQKFYDQLKLNESFVSLTLGALVVVAISALFFALIFQSRGVVEEKRVLNSVITPTPEAVEEEYVVLDGESLWDVAVKFYGDGFLFTKLVEANIDKLENPDNVPPGTVIIIPNL